MVYHRVNANFSDEALKTLKEIAAKNGKNMSEVLRDAISLEKWVQDIKEDNGRIFAERKGKVVELVIR